MKFQRYPRPVYGNYSPQKIAAAARSVKKEQERFALFPELVKFASPLDRITSKEADKKQYFDRLRNHQANTWRQARSIIRQLNAFSRSGLLRFWNTSGYPKDAHYLLSMAKKARAGFSYWSKLAALRRLQLKGNGN